ncbi:MAG: YcjX family protein [Beijerinckiaceae bacterium]
MSFGGGALSAVRSLTEYASGLFNPTVRLGVTGLSRSGKTVFITALAHALVSGARLPMFEASAGGRIRKASLAPQPDDAVPRFAVEEHLAALTGSDRHWPQSTNRISELRLVIEYESAAGWFGGPSTLTLDIVDYPGEWLLDLPLLEKSYAAWSAETLDLARRGTRAPLAAAFLAALGTVKSGDASDEMTARRLAEVFTAFLRSCRDEKVSLSSLPPGRFLMPGDLEGSPALTFAPLADVVESPRSDTLQATMERRYEAYKTHVVRPFFRDHFARLDRQIVLVDALTALNAGPAAVADLQAALADVLGAFRAGRNGLLSQVFSPRIDRVLFAATKADHLHHSSHDRLEAIVRALVDRAAGRAEGAGAAIDVAAIAAIRATREVQAKQGRTTMPCIAGVPLKGERLDDEVFDGIAEAALYPGELPDDPAAALSGGLDLRFMRFRPPMAERTADGRLKPLPQIRLDRALQFLIGDRLR